MNEHKITSEEYETAMKTVVKFRLQNQSFYGKLKFAKSPEIHHQIEYYDDIEKMMLDIWNAGSKSIMIEECKQVSKEEFEDNYLPF